MMVVNGNRRRSVELYTLMCLTANAMPIKDTDDYKKYKIGHNVLTGVLQVDIEMRAMFGGSVSKYSLEAKALCLGIVPFGYDQWRPMPTLVFASLFAKKVVNGNWLPDKKMRHAVQFVQDLYACADMFTGQDIGASSHVEKAYLKARQYGYYCK